MSIHFRELSLVSEHDLSGLSCRGSSAAFNGLIRSLPKLINAEIINNFFDVSDYHKAASRLQPLSVRLNWLDPGYHEDIFKDLQWQDPGGLIIIIYLMINCTR
jgi:hypothetical protein